MSFTSDLKLRMKEMSFKDVDVIFVKERYVFDRIMHIKAPGIKKRINVIKVEDFEDLRLVSEKEMNEAGWFRK